MEDHALIKRLCDIAFALGVLTVSLPVLAAAAVAIRLVMGRPVIFHQARTGLGGRSFTLYKLRTMRDAVDPRTGRSLPDEARLTGLGRFLRSTSVDELPTFVNVLKGDMSVIGPRPLLPEYLPLYTPEQARRHEVPPGVTGLAQVRGRNSLSWEDKLAYDIQYVEEHSLWFDARILTETVGTVLFQRGIAHPGAETMPPFTGSTEHPEGG
jgi:lipopolysaccharide/colanic/teichoic acid biosynthesis glycosyltransferase